MSVRVGAVRSAVAVAISTLVGWAVIRHAVEAGVDEVRPATATSCEAL